MNVLDFTLGAISLAVGLIAQPYVKSIWYAIKSRIKRRKNTQPNVYCDDLQSQIKELEKQINNVAERLSTRDTNRKHQVRREVREYLESLKNGK